MSPTTGPPGAEPSSTPPMEMCDLGLHLLQGAPSSSVPARSAALGIRQPF